MYNEVMEGEAECIQQRSLEKTLENVQLIFDIESDEGRSQLQDYKEFLRQRMEGDGESGARD